MGNLSKAHEQIKAIEEVSSIPHKSAMVHLTIGFLHVAIEVAATFRDYVKLYKDKR